jgi:hypothetical protein
LSKRVAIMVSAHEAGQGQQEAHHPSQKAGDGNAQHLKIDGLAKE